MGFSKSMASAADWAVRFIVVAALMVVGGLLGGGWWALAIVGLVPFAAGAHDICLLNVLSAQPPEWQGCSGELMPDTEHDAAGASVPWTLADSRGAR